MLLWLAVAHASPSLEPAARAALPPTPDGVDLTLVGVLPHHGGGAVVQLRPAIDGVPVDRMSTVRFGADGEVRRITSDPLPARRVEGPLVSAARAITAARQTVGGSRPRARLSWQVTGEVLRRVWTIELDGAPPGPTAPRVRVDAVSGAVMSVDDAADAVPRALVYREHPLAEPEPVGVPLPLAIQALSDDRAELLQCRDVGEIQTWILDQDQSLDVRVCTRVAADGPVDGDYLYEPVPYPADPARDEDDFVAPHVYWNVHRGLDWFDARGWVSAPGFDPRLFVTVNHRTTDFWTAETTSDPEMPLLPYNNAYSTGGYADGDDVWVPPELVFGQGSTVDFGYDAEVVHHELGHFVVRSQNGPLWSESTSYGPSVRANALNEGLADYFSAAIHSDPVLAEYVREGGIRDLSGTAVCATDLVGESHYDSLPFSQGLWAFRSSLPEADRATVDTLVIDSLSVMGPNADFPDASAVIEELVSERLGADAAAALSALWEARGIHDCPPVILVTPGEEPFAEYGLVGGSYWYATLGEVPGYLQYRVEIPEGGARVTLQFDQAQYLGFDPFDRNTVQPLVVVGRSGDRLTWTEEERETTVTFDGYTVTFDVTEWVSDGAEVTTAEEVGAEPHETNPQYELRHHEAVWDVESGGSYVFQLANGFERTATIYDARLTLEPPVVEIPDPDEAPGADPTEAEPGGCGCASTGSGGVLVWLGILGVRRRRG